MLKQRIYLEGSLTDIRYLLYNVPGDYDYDLIISDLNQIDNQLDELICCTLDLDEIEELKKLKEKTSTYVKRANKLKEEYSKSEEDSGFEK